MRRLMQNTKSQLDAAFTCTKAFAVARVHVVVAVIAVVVVVIALLLPLPLLLLYISRRLLRVLGSSLTSIAPRKCIKKFNSDPP